MYNYISQVDHILRINGRSWQFLVDQGRSYTMCKTSKYIMVDHVHKQTRTFKSTSRHQLIKNECENEQKCGLLKVNFETKK